MLFVLSSFVRLCCYLVSFVFTFVLLVITFPSDILVYALCFVELSEALLLLFGLILLLFYLSLLFPLTY